MRLSGDERLVVVRHPRRLPFRAWRDRDSVRRMGLAAASMDSSFEHRPSLAYLRRGFRGLRPTVPGGGAHPRRPAGVPARRRVGALSTSASRDHPQRGPGDVQFRKTGTARAAPRRGELLAGRTDHDRLPPVPRLGHPTEPRRSSRSSWSRQSHYARGASMCRRAGRARGGPTAARHRPFGLGSPRGSTRPPHRRPRWNRAHTYFRCLARMASTQRIDSPAIVSSKECGFPTWDQV